MERAMSGVLTLQMLHMSFGVMDAAYIVTLKGASKGLPGGLIASVRAPDENHIITIKGCLKECLRGAVHVMGLRLKEGGIFKEIS